MVWWDYVGTKVDNAIGVPVFGRSRGNDIEMIMHLLIKNLEGCPKLVFLIDRSSWM